MKIAGPKHKGLRLLWEQNDSSRLRPDMVVKQVDMLAVLQAVPSVEALQQFPHWRVHGLRGDRSGQISLTVTRNWRLVFRFDDDSQEIRDLDLVDYH